MIMSVCTHVCCCIMELAHVWRALFVDLRSFLIVSRNIIVLSYERERERKNARENDPKTIAIMIDY